MLACNPGFFLLDIYKPAGARSKLGFVEYVFNPIQGNLMHPGVTKSIPHTFEGGIQEAIGVCGAPVAHRVVHPVFAFTVSAFESRQG